MERLTLETHLRALDSYQPWQVAYVEAKRAETAAPLDVNVNDRAHLLGQISLLDLRDVQISARQRLMLEIAERDNQFLPLTHRLGLLAAFQVATLASETIWHPTGDDIFVRKGGFQYDAEIDHGEISVQPDENPIDRAVQIANELERIRTLLDTRRTVPVCMVWNHHYQGDRLDRDEVVLGSVNKPREAFHLTQPKIAVDNGVKTPVFFIPTRLNGVTKGQVIWDADSIRNQEEYEHPDLTVLSALAPSRRFAYRSVSALYIGGQEVTKRATKAIKDRAHYAKQLHQMRGSRPWPRKRG